MLHWYTNSNICFLTIAESMLRGIPDSETFIYKIVNPIYNIDKNKLNTIIWIVASVSLIISIIKLYKYIKNLDHSIHFKDFLNVKYIDIKL